MRVPAVQTPSAVVLQSGSSALDDILLLPCPEVNLTLQIERP